jgi:hypothetical protein
MKSFVNHKLKYILFLILIFSILSCENILEEEPLNQIGTEFYYKNKTDALTALTAAYAKLKSNNGYYRQQFLSNIFAASDQGASSWKHGDFRRGTIVLTDPNLTRTWTEIYVAIKDANNVIKNVPEIVDMEQDLKSRIIGEAKFLRALHYFNLVRCFGEVPLRTEPINPGDKGLPKANIEDIYAVIIADLKFATENCWGFGENRNGSLNNIGRVTKAAAHAMLAKVYLQIASSKRTAEEGNLGNTRYLALPESVNEYYRRTQEECDFVLQEDSYQLVSSLKEWKNIFAASNGNNPEMLFEIQGSSLPEQGTAVSNLFSPRQAGLSGGGWGGVNRLQPLFINNHLDKTDVRFLNGIVQEYQDASRSYSLNPASTGYFRTNTETGNSNGIFYVVFTSKYIDRNATTEYTSQQNWHVIRLADVYFMRAEALAEMNQNPALAEQDINQLRSRVGMPSFSSSGMNMADFRTSLLKERSAELFMEGHRFFDLTRMGVYDAYCKISFGNTIGARQAEDYVWPIPLIEVAANENIN